MEGKTTAQLKLERLLGCRRDGDGAAREEAEKEIIALCDGLVRKIIAAVFPQHRENHADDMLQEGRIKVLSCLERYDPERGSFSTYAAPFVKRGIGEYIARWQGLTYYSRSMLSRVDRAAAEAEGEGRACSVSEIAGIMGVSVRRVEKALEIRRATPRAADDGLEDVADGDGADPPALLEKAELCKALADAVGALPDTERRTVAMCCLSDVGGRKRVPDAAVAKALGIKTHEAGAARRSCLRFRHKPGISCDFAHRLWELIQFWLRPKLKREARFNC
ncbi:MAG: sigma-70 family RNA polymerase sigma factor [Clostridiales Family XIII bacterium]|jgi:RNA polymerase sigma factor (sigma-70 family)|nr:sigma-70 family RNA polymerase sigma factor [Clostridiales Family XIII bacterium]